MQSIFDLYHQMEAVSRSITAGLPDSSMLKSIGQMQSILNRYHQIEALSGQLTAGLLDSPVLKSIGQIEALSRQFTAGLQHNSVLKSISQTTKWMDSITPPSLQHNSVLKSISQMEALSSQLTTGLQHNSVMKSMSQMESLSRQLTAGLQHSSVMKSIGQIETFANSTRLVALTLQETPAMVAIREFLNTPFNPIVKEIVFDHLDSIEKEQLDITNYQDFAIDQSIQEELQRELAGNRDYNGLSNRAKLFLSWIFYNCLLPIFLTIVTSITMQHIQKIVQTDLQDKETPAEIRSYVRKPIPSVNKEQLKNYRVVIGSDVHFRKGPSMKSEIITMLPLGKLIEVLDRSNRSWLRVEVDIEGEKFVGWVSRRYTIFFK